MRFSILTLLGLVAVAAVGCMALMNASQLWGYLAYTVAFVVLWLAVVAAAYQVGSKRAYCGGFATCGLASLYTDGIADNGYLATHLLASYLYSVTLGAAKEGIYAAHGLNQFNYFRSIFHCLFSIAFAFLGGVTARYFYLSRQKQEARSPRPSTSSNGSV